MTLPFNYPSVLTLNTQCELIVVPRKEVVGGDELEHVEVDKALLLFGCSHSSFYQIRESMASLKVFGTEIDSGGIMSSTPMIPMY